MNITFTNLLRPIIHSKHFILMILIFLSPVANSSVTMIGNRIVYLSNRSSVNIEFTNDGIIPYVVQTWLDNGEKNSSPSTVTTPFNSSPAIFKIKPKRGQQLRISYTDSQKLPQDRESLFYFNFLQIPPINAEQHIKDSDNKVVVLVTNKVKFFYRPARIADKITQMKNYIKVYSSENVLNINNTSPFYLSLLKVEVKHGNTVYTKPMDMLPPFSEGKVRFNEINSLKKTTVLIYFINDQGAQVSYEYKINI